MADQVIIIAVGIPLRVFIFKRSTVAAFAVLFMTGDNVLFYKWYLVGVKNISSHAHKTGSWYLLAVLFKIADRQPPSFFMGVPTVFSVTFLTEQVINTQSLMH